MRRGIWLVMMVVGLMVVPIGLANASHETVTFDFENLEPEDLCDDSRSVGDSTVNLTADASSYVDDYLSSDACEVVDNLSVNSDPTGSVLFAGLSFNCGIVVEDLRIELSNGFDQFVDCTGGPSNVTLDAVTTGFYTSLTLTPQGGAVYVDDLALGLFHVNAEPELVSCPAELTFQEGVSGQQSLTATDADDAITGVVPLGLPTGFVGFLAASDPGETAVLTLVNNSGVDGTYQISVEFFSSPSGQTVTCNTSIVVLPPADADGDGVPDDVDVCLGTEFPDEPTRGLKKNRFAATAAGFASTDGVVQYSLADTGGCSATQIIDEAGLGKGHTKFGISRGALMAWIDALPTSPI